MATSIPRKVRAEQTKQALFQRGHEYLRNVGSPDDFVIEDITGPCGVSKATFYLYYKSKEDFYHHIKMSYAHEVRDVYLARLNGSGPVHERILLFVQAWVEAVRSSDIETSRDWLALTADKNFRITAREHGMSIQNYLSILSDKVREGVEQGEFVPNTPCDAIAKQIMVVLHGVHSLSVMTNKELDYEKCTGFITDLVNNGVLKPWLASKGDEDEAL